MTLGSGNITYTLAVANHGPSTATGVVVADQLHPSVTFVSATSTQGACSQAGGVVTCSVGTMASGATVTITIVVRPTAVGTLGNNATVTSQTADPNAANNTSGVSTIVEGAPRTPVVRPRPAVCSSLVVTPRSLKVGKRTTIVARVRLSNGKAFVGAQVRVTAPGNIVRTVRTNRFGIARVTIKPTRAGIARVAVLRNPRCTTARVGIVGIIKSPSLTG